jgi:WD40 repeat protein
MHTLEITIQRDMGTGWPVVVEHHLPGSLPSRQEGVIHLDEERRTDLLRQEYSPEAYGTVLGQALFQGRVRDAFMQARATSEERLRVLLVIEAPDLKTLRWERLCAPARQGERWRLLALDQQLIFSRYLPSLTDRRFPAIGRRDLRALVVVAAPPKDNAYNLASFDAKATVARVQTVLGEIPSTVLAHVEGSAGPPTLDELCAQITGQPYTLLHIVAHGQFRSRDGETILYLLDPDGAVSPVAATRFLERLDQLQGSRGLPHLAFLSTCESAMAQAESETALGGLAQRLVRELGMPAVVAMTDKVTMATAEALACHFYERLREHGEVDRALVEASAALANAGDILVPALYSRLGGRPLFSDTLDRELTENEMAYALEQLDKLIAQRAPVLWKPYDALATTLRGTLATMRADLSDAMRTERDEALVDLNTLCEEVLDLNFRALALGNLPPAYDARCPFPGLYAFQADDQEFFFGREALVAHLVARLGTHPFLAVLGASGSGKSSLVLAGLVPALQAQDRMLYMRPGSDPVTRLERALMTRSNPAPGRDLLVVDQFEELFTLCADPTSRQVFLDRLLALVPPADGQENEMRLDVVLTMRADFWGECAPYPALRALMQSHQELLAAMATPELRSAMEQQAARVGLRFEADLSHTILAVVQDEPGAMPLLQHLLQELWQRRHGRWLKAEEYRALGGIQQAIAYTADALYDTLSPTEQVSMRHLFTRLTRLGDDTGAEEAYRDTRRRVSLSEIIPAGEDAQTLRRLVQRCADARLVVTSVDEESGETEMEVTHEALIRHWPRLRAWLDEDRSSLRLLASLNQAAQEWDREGRHDNHLPRWNARLEEAEVLFRQQRFVQNALERDYLDACRALRDREQAEKEAQERREREALEQLAAEQTQRAEEQTRSAAKLRKWFIGAAVIGFIAIMASLFAFYQGRVARNNEHKAKRQTAIAKASLVRSLLSTSPSEGLVLAIEAVGLSQTLRQVPIEVQSSLLEAVQIAQSGIMDLNVLRGSEAWINSVAISPDGQTIISGSEDGIVHAWDFEGHSLWDSFQDHQGGINSVAISPDGQTIVSGGADGIIRLWDLKGKSRGQPFKGHEEGEVRSVAISPDGQTIVSGGTDGTVRLWDFEGHSLRKSFQGHQGWVNSVAISPDGQTIVSGGADDTIRLWDLKGNTRKAFQGHQAGVNSVAISPDGQTIVSGGADDTVRLWDLEGKPRGDPFQGHQAGVNSVAISPDGQTIVSGSYDDTIRLWDLKGKPRGYPFQGHQAGVKSVAISPDGQTIVSGSNDVTIRLWDLKGTPWGKPFEGHRAGVNSIAISSDGQTVVSGDIDGIIRLWDLKGNPQEAFQGHQAGVNSVAISPDGQMIASGGNDGTIRLWDLKGNPQGSPFEGHQASVNSVAISPNGQMIVSGSNDGTIRLWDLKGKSWEKPFHGHLGWINSVAISRDGQTIVSGGQDGTVRLWDLKGDSRKVFQGHQGFVLSVAISPDGLTIVSGDSNGFIRLWDLQGTPRGQPFKAHQEAVTSVAISPDGQTIVSGGIDNVDVGGTVRLWDLNGTPRGEFQGHQGLVQSVAIGPDGQTIVSGGGNGTIRLWQIAPWETWLREACNRLQHHTALTNPQTKTEHFARKTCEPIWWETSLREACEQLQRPFTLSNPQTKTAKFARKTCEPIWNQEEVSKPKG